MSLAINGASTRTPVAHQPASVTADAPKTGGHTPDFTTLTSLAAAGGLLAGALVGFGARGLNARAMGIGAVVGAGAMAALVAVTQLATRSGANVDSAYGG